LQPHRAETGNDLTQTAWRSSENIARACRDFRHLLNFQMRLLALPVRLAKVLQSCFGWRTTCAASGLGVKVRAAHRIKFGLLAAPGKIRQTKGWCSSTTKIWTRLTEKCHQAEMMGLSQCIIDVELSQCINHNMVFPFRQYSILFLGLFPMPCGEVVFFDPLPGTTMENHMDCPHLCRSKNPEIWMYHLCTFISGRKHIFAVI